MWPNDQQQSTHFFSSTFFSITFLTSGTTSLLPLVSGGTFSLSFVLALVATVSTCDTVVSGGICWSGGTVANGGCTVLTGVKGNAEEWTGGGAVAKGGGIGITPLE